MGHRLSTNWIQTYFKYIPKINQINVLQNLAGHKCHKLKPSTCLNYGSEVSNSPLSIDLRVFGTTTEPNIKIVSGGSTRVSEITGTRMKGVCHNLDKWWVRISFSVIQKNYTISLFRVRRFVWGSDIPGSISDDLGSWFFGVQKKNIGKAASKSILILHIIDDQMISSYNCFSVCDI